jgi:hypothetical protein
LWHGAGWLFVMWGVLHGLGLIVEKGVAKFINKRGFYVPKVFGFIVTFHFVVLTWIVFRSPDLDTLFLFLRRIKETFFIYSIQEQFQSYFHVLFLLFIGFSLHWLPKEITRTVKITVIKAHFLVKLFLMVVLSVLIYQFSMFDVKPFIYFRF